MRISLFGKMLLFIVVPLVAILLLVSYLSYDRTRALMERQIYAEVEVVARGLSRNLSGHINMIGFMVEQLAAMERTDELFKLQVDGVERVRALERLNAACSKLAVAFPVLYGVGVVDEHGVVVAHSVSELAGRNLGEREYIRQALAGHQGLSTVQNQFDNAPVTCIAAPVRGESGIRGAVFGVVDIKRLGSVLLSETVYSNAGEVFVLDPSGTVLMHPDEAQLGRSYPLIPDWSGGTDQSGASLHSTVVTDGEHITYITQIPGTEWLAVYEMAKKRIFAPFEDMAKTNILIGICAAALLAGVIVLQGLSWAGGIRRAVLLIGNVSDGRLKLSGQEEAKLAKDCSRRDEVGELCRAVRRMVGSLRSFVSANEQATDQARQEAGKAEYHRRAAEDGRREGVFAVAGQIGASVEVIAPAATELAVQVRQAETGAFRQADRLGHILGAMTDINSMVLDMAQTAGQAAAMAALAREKAGQGGDVFTHIAQNAKRMQQELQTLNRDMGHIGGDLRGLSSLAGTIGAHAEQTRLLAVNAGLEAARNGERGQEFITLSEEMHRLAKAVMESASKAGGSLCAVLETVGVVTRRLDTALGIADDAVISISESGVVFREIVELADSTARQSEVIAALSRDHSTASSLVTQSLSLVDNIADETSQAMENAQISVQNLGEQIRVLEELIRDMRAEGESLRKTRADQSRQRSRDIDNPQKPGPTAGVAGGQASHA